MPHIHKKKEPLESKKFNRNAIIFTVIVLMIVIALFIYLRAERRIETVNMIPSVEPSAKPANTNTP